MNMRRMAITLAVVAAFAGPIWTTGAAVSTWAQGGGSIQPEGVVGPLLQYQGRLTSVATGSPVSGSTLVRRGYSVDNQENVLGIRCIAVPVFDRKASPVAAISVSDLAVRITDDRVGNLAAGLLDAGGAISARLGYRGGYGVVVAAPPSGTRLPLSGVASAGQVWDGHPR